MQLSNDLKKVIFIKLLSCKAKRNAAVCCSYMVDHVPVESLFFRFLVKEYFYSDFMRYCEILDLSKNFKRLMRFGAKHIFILLAVLDNLAEYKGIYKTGIIRQLLNIPDCSMEYSRLLKKVNNGLDSIDSFPRITTRQVEKVDKMINSLLQDRLQIIGKQYWREDINIYWIASNGFGLLFQIH